MITLIFSRDRFAEMTKRPRLRCPEPVTSGNMKRSAGEAGKEVGVAAKKKVKKKKKKKSNKAPAKKTLERKNVWSEGQWVVKFGKLKPGAGNPGNVKNLFRVVGEKIPYGALDDVKAKLAAKGITRQGVYIAHDSIGCPRYIGRGDIFGRLAARRDTHPDELVYFSFYVVAEKKHEREAETLLIRGAGFLLEFNERKKHVNIKPGDIKDYEAGTEFFERQKKRGRKKT